MVKCNACGASYEPILPDGMQYFHVCSPLSRVDVAAAIAGGKVAYPAGKDLAFYQAKATAAGLPIGQANVLAADDLLATTTFERATKRDENARSTAAKDALTMKAAGAGVTTIASPPSSVIIVP